MPCKQNTIAIPELYVCHKASAEKNQFPKVFSIFLTMSNNMQPLRRTMHKNYKIAPINKHAVKNAP